MSTLNARQRDCLRLRTEGMTNAEVGVQLTISEHTVKSHLKKTFELLGARNIAQAVVIALRSGELTLDGSLTASELREQREEKLRAKPESQRSEYRAPEPAYDQFPSLRWGPAELAHNLSDVVFDRIVDGLAKATRRELGKEER